MLSKIYILALFIKKIMGQEEVKNILEKTRGWLLSREIASLAKISLGSVQSSLQRMIKWGEVEARKAREVIKDGSRITSNHPGIAYRLRDNFAGRRMQFSRVYSPQKARINNKKFKKNGIICSEPLKTGHSLIR